MRSAKRAYRNINRSNRKVKKRNRRRTKNRSYRKNNRKSVRRIRGGAAPGSVQISPELIAGTRRSNLKASVPWPNSGKCAEVIENWDNPRITNAIKLTKGNLVVDIDDTVPFNAEWRWGKTMDNGENRVSFHSTK